MPPDRFSRFSFLVMERGVYLFLQRTASSLHRNCARKGWKYPYGLDSAVKDKVAPSYSALLTVRSVYDILDCPDFRPLTAASKISKMYGTFPRGNARQTTNNLRLSSYMSFRDKLPPEQG
mmetsp:Transcript_28432/g.111504  ORF Transcript_28432/g.111504 Transcript_28432/m.111504 type:complete len:120 (+) Transcript_28432:174-533(+)